jgi:tripartite-type tricarboxylate transporter receptor subunit TctC
MNATSFLRDAIVGLALANSSAALCDEYPSRPITLVVPFAAGGGTDTQGRLIAQRLHARLGQAVVVENKAGAGSMLGAAAVAKAKPDGYTILLVTNSAIAVTPVLYKTPLFDPMADFVPISMVSGSPFFLATNPKSPIHSVADLIRIAKERPKQLSFSTSGAGSTAHVFMELLMRHAGIELVHIPYGGTAQAMNDVIAGHVDMTFSDPQVAVDMRKSGRVRLIGISTKTRHPAAADVPSIAEGGLAAYDALAWIAIVAPARTPGDIVRKLHIELGQIIDSKEFAEFRENNASVPMNIPTVEGMQSFFKTEIATWGQILRGAGLAGIQ